MAADPPVPPAPAADGAAPSPTPAAAPAVAAPASGASSSAASATSGAAAPSSDSTSPAPSPAPAAPAAGAVKDGAAKTEPAPGAAPAAEPAKSESTPSLLEAARGKPKKEDAKTDAKAPAVADAKASPDAKPAPAEAAKAEPAKDAKAEGEKPDAKATDAVKDAAKAPDPAKEATPAQAPAPLKYEAFKVPDGIKLDDKELGKFTEIVGSRQLPQEDAQRLVDLYVEERKADVSRVRQEQRETWNTLNDTWKTELRNNPDLGGNRLETSLSMAKAVVEEFLTPEQARIYLAHTTNNGMGNFIEQVRLLHNIGKALNIFEDGIVPANPLAPKMPKGPGKRGFPSCGS